MASQPELPDLNFVTEPERRYDTQEIAERVLWPTVDVKWGGDFRKLSLSDMESFRLPKAGLSGGRFLEVTLEALAESDIVEIAVGEVVIERMETIHSVEVTIEETCQDRLAQIIAMAEEAQPGILEGWVDADDEDSVKASGLLVKEGIVYVFSSDGTYYIRPYKSLQDLDGQEVWNTGYVGFDSGMEENADDDVIMVNPEVTFAEEDVKNLLSALEILDAPAEPLEYLELLALDNK